MALLELVGYSFTYPGADRPALRDVSLAVDAGQLVLLCGQTGSGKTTLLRSLKPEIAPVGTTSGTILGIEGEVRIGFVSQDPENQIVMDSVYHELAFGLENLGVEPGVIRRRIAETASFFGIDAWIEGKVAELSGGQKQILNLASVLVMQPDVLILDEPTAQLDPIATKGFLQVLSRVNDEMGITVILSEHRFEEVLTLADRVVMLEDGAIAIDGTAQGFIREVYSRESALIPTLPASTRLAHALGEREDYPLTVKEGRAWMRRAQEEGPFGFKPLEPALSPASPALATDEVVLEARGLWFRYRKGDDFVLRDTSLAVRRAEIHAVLGSNGGGKTTLLAMLCGGRKPQRGTVSVQKGQTMGLLSQDPRALFTSETAYGELMEWSELGGYTSAHVERTLEDFGLSAMRERHPFDLSGGQMQKLALAKVLLLTPDILLLDEPTKGIDANAKGEIARVLVGLKLQGTTIILVTHDIEFAALVADRCSMLFDKSVICTEDARDFFAGNLFYTTEVNRIMSETDKRYLLVEDVVTDA